MKIEGLQISSIRKISSEGSGDWWDKSWETGFYKTEARDPVWLGYEGLRGDVQADRKNHGGIDKAVCVYPVEHYSGWREELVEPEMLPGSFGENFTTTGLLESEVCVGDVFEIGTAGVRVQVSQPRQPCWKLARRWKRKDLAHLVEQSGKTGFYFRVLHHGFVEVGDDIQLFERPHPEWSISRCNEFMHRRKDDSKGAKKLLTECPALSGSWKDALWRRAESQSSL